MADLAPTAHTAHTADPTFARTVAEEGVAILGDLAKLGLRLGEALERHVLCAEQVQVHQAKTDPDCMVMPACDLAGVALSFNRISRAIRMTLALRERLANPRPARWTRETQPSLTRAQRATDDDAPDRPLREEARENLFDTPDVEGLLGALVPDLPACSAEASQVSPSAAAPDRSTEEPSAHIRTETTLPPSFNAGPALTDDLAKPP
jgi:hypothetical protein